MSREVRKVPLNWQHPEDPHSYGDFIPLLNGSFIEALADWNDGKALWAKGLRRDWVDKEKIVLVPLDEVHAADCSNWEDYYGRCPTADRYMPVFPSDAELGLCMYETCTEGTPISPVFKTAEELAHWLADNNASAFGSDTATYEQWMNTINVGDVPSAVMRNGTLISGPAAAEKLK